MLEFAFPTGTPGTWNVSIFGTTYVPAVTAANGASVTGQGPATPPLIFGVYIGLANRSLEWLLDVGEFAQLEAVPTSGGRFTTTGPVVAHAASPQQSLYVVFTNVASDAPGYSASIYQVTADEIQTDVRAKANTRRATWS